jgi:hypothetical protein
MENTILECTVLGIFNTANSWLLTIAQWHNQVFNIRILFAYAEWKCAGATICSFQTRESTTI